MSILQNEETELSRPCELKQKIKTKLWTELAYVDVTSHFSIKNQNKRNTRNTVAATQKSLGFKRAFWNETEDETGRVQKLMNNIFRVH